MVSLVPPGGLVNQYLLGTCRECLDPSPHKFMDMEGRIFVAGAY